ncbi:MAG: adenosine deaminase [Chloroflexi bacterium]|nr:adenosine deaminase [Chloroflexota bacterium]
MEPQLEPRHRIFYKSLPKVELHRHLEGSLRLSTMLEVARTYDLDLPYRDIDAFRSLVQVRDGEPFTHHNFLAKFNTLRLFYQAPEVIRRVVREAIADAAADNVRYMELRFTPVALTRIKDFPLAEAMDWVIETANEAGESYGVQTRLIASVNRHESLELAQEVLKHSLDRKDRGIIALDLAGGEADFPGHNFVGLFTEARQAGLRITIHAGEWGGPENVRLGIEQLAAERIGHGIRIMEDAAVVALAREREIVFEVCPTSNYQSGVVSSLSHNPLMGMINAGLIVTINTDDPSISQIDLSDEYELACESLGLTLAQLRHSIVQAARAAFLSDGEHAALASSLEREFAEKNAAGD